jgi:hypothetical protein
MPVHIQKIFIDEDCKEIEIIANNLTVSFYHKEQLLFEFDRETWKEFVDELIVKYMQIEGGENED